MAIGAKPGQRVQAGCVGGEERNSPWILAIEIPCNKWLREGHERAPERRPPTALLEFAPLLGHNAVIQDSYPASS